MNSGKKTISFGRRWLLCGIAAVLMAGGYLGLALSATNRLFMYFGWRDTAALLIGLAAGGLLAAALLHGAARATRGRSDAWLSPGFYFWAVLAVFNFFPTLRQSWVKHVPWLSGTAYYLMIWGLGGMLTAAGCRWPRMRRMASAGWRGVALLWPLLLLVPFSLLTAKMWAGADGDPARLGRRAGGAGAPVVI